MTRPNRSWWLITGLFAAEAVALAALLLAVPLPAGAQFFDDRFPFQNNRRQQQQQPRGMFDWFGPPPQQYPQERQQNEESQPRREAPPPVDYSRAPSPKKNEAKNDAATTSIMVLGDSMADWLAYGLEQAYADTPEIGVLRRHKTNSGLIRTEQRDSRGEYPDWPQAARELIASQKPKFVLMMIGINDRRSIRETAQSIRAARTAQPRVDDPAALELDRPAGEKTPSDKPAADKPVEAAAEPPAPTGNRTLEFRTDAWSEAYIRRIDDTIAALKTSGVPVFWVGLPPLRGQKSAADMSFLNDLYRSRADKAGIIYIDVWDGFVDEDGRYAQYGPDLEGQTRRLRAGDGVHFTTAGARKLAHYVEREVQRWLSSRTAVAALPAPDEPKVETPSAKPAGTAAPAAAAGSGRARPLSGPTVPLITERSAESEDLLGGNARQSATDAIANKVLVRGEAMPAPAGRADDFAWPRREVAPVGSDPLVATTELPMTPMVAEKPAQSSTTTTAAATTTGGTESGNTSSSPRPRRTTPRPAYAENQQSVYRPDYRRPPPQQPAPFFSFGPLFGGR